MDNISIERVWEDAGFFEIKITAQAELISVSVKSYIESESIDKLASQIAAFLKTIRSSFFWENGVKGDSFTPYVSLEFWHDDNPSHVIIEVYMEIDDGASFDKHNCCFFIRTEIGLLEHFGNSIAMLNEHGIGKKVILNQIDYSSR
ncbi:MAG: hypothetical protein FWH51_03515 [Dehalococcoidia bacterium]|nr:hypothetical protein [Dehalococcoidia bacterium]